MQFLGAQEEVPHQRGRFGNGLVSIHAVTTPSTALGHGRWGAYWAREHFPEEQDPGVALTGLE